MVKESKKTIRKINTRQIITPANDPYEFHVRTYKNRLRLQHKDSLLENRGISDARAIELYLDIITDDLMYTSWDKQMVEIEARPWHVQPAKDTKKARNIAKWVTEVLQKLELVEEDEAMGFMLGTTSSGYYDLLRAMGLGVVSGMSPISVQWREIDNKYYPILRAVDPARILFEASEDGTKIFPKILTRRHYTHGLMAPSKSLILYRYWAIPNGDPYGYGLGRFTYNLVEWRREGLTRWLNIIDKYSDPVKEGTYPDGAQEEEVEKFTSALTNLGTDGTIVKPVDFNIEYYSPPTGVHELVRNFIDYMSASISKVLTGEAVTGEKDATTTYVRDKVSNSIRIVKAAGWSRSFDSLLNRTLIKWMVNANFPGEPVPMLMTEWVDVDSKLLQLEKLKNLGYNASQAELQELVDIAPKPKRQKPKPKFNFDANNPQQSSGQQQSLLDQ